MMMAFVCSEVLVGIVRFQKRYCVRAERKKNNELYGALSFFTSS